MILAGTLVDAFAIMTGAFIGKRVTRMSESMSQLEVQGMALIVIVMGAMMSAKSEKKEGY